MPVSVDGSTQSVHVCTESAEPLFRPDRSTESVVSMLKKLGDSLGKHNRSKSQMNTLNQCTHCCNGWLEVQARRPRPRHRSNRGAGQSLNPSCLVSSGPQFNYHISSITTSVQLSHQFNYHIFMVFYFTY